MTLEENLNMKKSGFKPPKLLPGENPKQYLERNWDVVAPNAYLNYKLDGRGAVVNDFSGLSSVPHSYFRETTLAERIDPLSIKLLKLVRAYDPEKEVVFLMTTPEKRVGACCSGAPKDHDSPPDLYERLAKKLKQQSN
jgi:hypothetical protein